MTYDISEFAWKYTSRNQTPAKVYTLAVINQWTCNWNVQYKIDMSCDTRAIEEQHVQIVCHSVNIYTCYISEPGSPLKRLLYMC